MIIFRFWLRFPICQSAASDKEEFYTLPNAFKGIKGWAAPVLRSCEMSSEQLRVAAVMLWSDVTPHHANECVKLG